MKAYVVNCSDADHGSVVEFAERSKDVSRYANERCGCEYIEREVRRCPEFDKYAPGPVTIPQYLAEGWWWECSGCGRHVHEDDSPIVIRGHVYHSRECVEKDLEGMTRWDESTGRGRRHKSITDHLRAIRRWLRTHSTTSAVVAK